MSLTSEFCCRLCTWSSFCATSSFRPRPSRLHRALYRRSCKLDSQSKEGEQLSVKEKLFCQWSGSIWNIRLDDQILSWEKDVKFGRQKQFWSTFSIYLSNDQSYISRKKFLDSNTTLKTVTVVHVWPSRDLRFNSEGKICKSTLNILISTDRLTSFRATS